LKLPRPFGKIYTEVLSSGGGMTVSERFSDRLRRMRSERGITQRQLASMMYIDRSTVARWENGSRVPDLELLPRLARCLGVDVVLLVPDDEPRQATPVVIVVDDEAPILTGELNTLRESLPDAQIAGFRRPSEALEFARNNRVSLAFVDIEMGKTSGFQVCERLLEANPMTNVVYLTAFPDYALEAWDTGACGFLVKPLDGKDLQRMLHRLKYPIGDGMGGAT